MINYVKQIQKIAATQFAGKDPQGILPGNCTARKVFQRNDPIALYGAPAIGNILINLKTYVISQFSFF